jgi:hypothetical protein
VGRGFFYSTASGIAYNLLSCDIAIKNISYEYCDMSQKESTAPISSFRTLAYSMSDDRTTKRLATMLDTDMLSAASAYRSIGAAVQPGSAYEDAFALSMSVSMVGSSASIFESSEATGATSLSPILVSRIPLLPLAGFGISIVVLW